MTEIPNFPNYTIDFDGNIFSKKSNKFIKQSTLLIKRKVYLRLINILKV